MNERVYLTLEDVLFIHEEQIRLFGRVPGVRDEGLILSALLRPQTGYYGSLIEEAAALWESLMMNHGFVDGNKRVAFASTVIFLELNGLTPTGTEHKWLAFISSNIEAGTFRKPVLEAWLSENTELVSGT